MIKSNDFISGTELSILKEMVGCTLKTEESEIIDELDEKAKLQIKKNVFERVKSKELPIDILEFVLEFQSNLETDKEKQKAINSNIWNLIIKIAEASEVMNNNQDLSENMAQVR